MNLWSFVYSTNIYRLSWVYIGDVKGKVNFRIYFIIIWRDIFKYNKKIEVIYDKQQNH